MKVMLIDDSQSILALAQEIIKDAVPDAEIQKFSFRLPNSKEMLWADMIVCDRDFRARDAWEYMRMNAPETTCIVFSSGASASEHAMFFTSLPVRWQSRCYVLPKQPPANYVKRLRSLAMHVAKVPACREEDIFTCNCGKTICLGDADGCNECHELHCYDCITDGVCLNCRTVLAEMGVAE